MTLSLDARNRLAYALANRAAADEVVAAIGLGPLGNTYYVDTNYGSDTVKNGSSPDAAFATIQKAITVSNATINWSYWPQMFNVIRVAPGTYAENLTPPYGCIIIGDGVAFGTGTGAEIHPTTGSAFTGTFLGTILYNLSLEGNTASTPILDLGVCNDSAILSCRFGLGADVAGVAAIDTDNSSHLWVEDCDFLSLMGTHKFAYAGYHRGGADKYLASGRYLNNRIEVETTGIYTADTCTTSNTIIRGNTIVGGASVIGIYNGDGNAWIADNTIMVGAGGDAISNAAHTEKTTNNHVNVAGTAATETA